MTKQRLLVWVISLCLGAIGLLVAPYAEAAPQPQAMSHMDMPMDMSNPAQHCAGQTASPKSGKLACAVACYALVQAVLPAAAVQLQHTSVAVAVASPIVSFQGQTPYIPTPPPNLG